MLDRVPEAEAAERIAAVGAAGSCSYRQVDVTDRAGVDAALAAIDPLDVAIGNAGIVEAAPFLEVSQAQWQAHLDINVTGCFNVGQAAARLMVERGTRGQIIFTGSWVGEIPWPEISAYSRLEGGRAHARALDGARARRPRDPRERRRARDRDGRHGAAPVRDRSRTTRGARRS